MNTVSVRYLKNFFPLLLAAVLPVSNAYAQLEEIIVTATKRAESSQDIPLSIETVSGETMMDMGITDLAELADTIPNLQVGYGVTSQAITIRGLGTGQERSFEQSVAMFIDGIYMPRSRQYQSPFLDAERVEVARGPQSVIHGLNSTAGAISVVTNKTRPGDAAFLDLTADYELEHGGPSLVAVAGGSPSDTLGLRAALKISGRDGYFNNSFTGEDEGDTDELLLRISAVWELSEEATLTVKYERAEKEMEGNTGELFDDDAGIFAAGTGFAEPDDGVLNWTRSSNGCNPDRNGLPDPITVTGAQPELCPEQRTQSDTIIASLEWQLPGHVLTVAGGHSEFEYDISLDLDTTADAFVVAGIDEDFEQDSVEIRLTSEKGGMLDYLVGGYYQKWENYNINPAQYGPALLGGLLSAAGPFGANVMVDTAASFQQESELWSMFGQVTVNATDYLRITGGVRYTDEDKQSLYDARCHLGFVDAGLLIPQPLPGPLRLCNTDPSSVGLFVDRSSDNWLPEVALQWGVSEDIMLYAKWGESAKSGGFTSAQRTAPSGMPFAPEDQEYQDEEATGYEAGFKSRLLNNSVELNVAFYRTEFDDLQVNSFTPSGAVIVQRVTNAASAVSQGVEVDGRWQAGDWLLLGGSFAYTDAEYDSFVNGTCNFASGMTSPCDQSDRSLPLAPEWTGNIYANTRFPVADNINAIADLNVSFSDEFYTDASLEPAGLQDSYAKLSARIGVEATDGKWSLALVGRNLTDKEVLSSSQSFLASLFQTTYLGYLEPPRTIMIQGNYRFGGE
ncbi:MAG: TonB-dependent receptor [Gammaproteobacteria bacterium]|nr:TonB-dependent receptor [Gammaproteobacteria bacterium]